MSLNKYIVKNNNEECFCSFCDDIIQKNDLKFGMFVKCIFFDAIMPKWAHLDCYEVPVKTEHECISLISGFDDLT